MKGIYCLLIKIEENQKISIGAIGTINFPSGYYVYVGSAQNNLEKRVARHKSSIKNKHWHIDYLLEKAKILKVFYKQSEKSAECISSKELEKYFSHINGFGCRDCKCSSHLFYSTKKRELIKHLICNNWLQM